jgi:diaminobutyrate-2-oxoglutarate transaminase
MKTIERLESEVRTYCRAFPAVFTRACGVWLEDRSGRRYLDFFAGAGALNYGHNNPVLKQALISYLQSDGITHSLDMATEAKIQFLDTFERRVLRPRDLPYKVMFPGPTGTNAVEAALKLARKVTGRPQVVSFTNAFHGMTLGSLAVTGNASKRAGAGVPLTNVVRAPYDGYLGNHGNSIDYLQSLFADRSSGFDAPAAFLLETVQAEGGVNVASAAWLRDLAALARTLGALLIVDDVQVGCGRTGRFFSFEEAGVVPDIVCLSKSLSGFGLPLAVTLMRPEHDVWQPGEHNGTFRGHNPAFVTAAASLEHYWSDASLSKATEDKSLVARRRLEQIARACNAQVRGRGMILGMACADRTLPARISAHAFAHGLIIETAGSEDQVLKLLPPLTITADELTEGLDRLELAVGLALDVSSAKASARRTLKAVAS